MNVNWPNSFSRSLVQKSKSWLVTFVHTLYTIFPAHQGCSWLSLSLPQGKPWKPFCKRHTVSLSNWLDERWVLFPNRANQIPFPEGNWIESGNSMWPHWVDPMKLGGTVEETMGKQGKPTHRERIKWNGYRRQMKKKNVLENLWDSVPAPFSVLLALFPPSLPSRYIYSLFRGRVGGTGGRRRRERESLSDSAFSTEPNSGWIPGPWHHKPKQN